jgi:hypothetical protein
MEDCIDAAVTGKWRRNGGKLMDAKAKRIASRPKRVGGVAEGEALVSKMPLMGWGNVGAQNGYTVERNHPRRSSVQGRCFVFTEPRLRKLVGYGPHGTAARIGSVPVQIGNNDGLCRDGHDVPSVTDFDRDPPKSSKMRSRSCGWRPGYRRGNKKARQ